MKTKKMTFKTSTIYVLRSSKDERYYYQMTTDGKHAMTGNPATAQSFLSLSMLENFVINNKLDIYEWVIVPVELNTPIV